MIGEPSRKVIEHIMPRCRLNTLMPERFLRQADITPGQFGPDEAPKVMRFHVCQPDVRGGTLDHPPSGRQMHGAGGRTIPLAGKTGKDVGALDRTPR